MLTRSPRSSRLWRCRVDGSECQIVLDLDGGEILTWDVSARGVVVGYRTEIDARSYRIALLDAASGTTIDLLSVPGRLGFHLSTDPVDGRSLFFDRTEAVDSDLFALLGD